MNDKQFEELIKNSDIQNGRNYILETIEKYVFGKRIRRYFKSWNKQFLDLIEENKLSKRFEGINKYDYLFYDPFSISINKAPYVGTTVSNGMDNSNKFRICFRNDIHIGSQNNLIELINDDLHKYQVDYPEEGFPETFSGMDWLYKKCMDRTYKNAVKLSNRYILILSIEKNTIDCIDYESIHIDIMNSSTSSVTYGINLFWCSDWDKIQFCTHYNHSAGTIDDYYIITSKHYVYCDRERIYRSKEKLFTQEAIEFFKYITSVDYRIKIITGKISETSEFGTYKLTKHSSEYNPDYKNIVSDHFDIYRHNDDGTPQTQYYHQLAFKYAIIDNPIFKSENSDKLISMYDKMFEQEYFITDLEREKFKDYKPIPLNYPMFESYIISAHRLNPDYYIVAYKYYKHGAKLHKNWENIISKIDLSYDGDKYGLEPTIPAPDFHKRYYKEILEDIIYRAFTSYHERILQDFIETTSNRI